MTNPQSTIEGRVSEVEIISQQVEEETKSLAPVQLVNFTYRDLPLAALDLSVAGSQLLSNLDEEYQREGFKCITVCWNYSLDQPSHLVCVLFRVFVYVEPVHQKYRDVKTKEELECQKDIGPKTQNQQSRQCRIASFQEGKTTPDCTWTGKGDKGFDIDFEF